MSAHQRRDSFLLPCLCMRAVRRVRGAMRWGAVQCGGVRCRAMQCLAVPCGAVLCGAVQCGACKMRIPTAVYFSSSASSASYASLHSPAKCLIKTVSLRITKKVTSSRPDNDIFLY